MSEEIGVCVFPHYSDDYMLLRPCSKLQHAPRWMHLQLCGSLTKLFRSIHDLILYLYAP